MTRRIIRGILIVITIGVISLVGTVVYHTYHQKDEVSVVGTSSFSALDLLSNNINTTSESAIKASLQVYTSGKFNPETAYILSTGYKKSSQSNGVTSFQFYIVVPEVKSVYQINLTQGTFGSPTVNLVCAPEDIQKAQSNTCYQPPNEESYVSTGYIIYA